MKKKVYLIGFMGAGKSALARTMQQRYHVLTLEMDDYIEMEQRMKISQIFEEKGEEAFRRMETHLLMYLRESPPLVISCGGGVATREENVSLMREGGIVVYLKASPQTIFDRVKDNHDRPILENNKTLEFIEELMEKRRPLYERAADVTLCVDEMSLTSLAEEVWRLAGGEEE